jgi:hypothetical protein
LVLDLYRNKNIDSLFTIELRKPIVAVKACSNIIFNGRVFLFSPSILESPDYYNHYGNSCIFKNVNYLPKKFHILLETLRNYFVKREWSMDQTFEP